jgi:actin cytoskeleton-regulatory complex protein SLA1
MHTQVAPPGQSLQELNQQRAMQQQFGLMPQVTGYGQVPGLNPGVNGIMPQHTGFPPFQQHQGMQFAHYQQPQPTGFPLTVQQQLFNGQHAASSPFADPVNSFHPQAMFMQQSFSPQPLQPQITGINALLPPSLIPQQTGMGPGMMGPNGYGQVPPVPPIPSQPTAAALIPQKTGPAPSVRFGVNSGPKRVAPKLPTKKANLASASKFNHHFY